MFSHDFLLPEFNLSTEIKAEEEGLIDGKRYLL